LGTVSLVSVVNGIPTTLATADCGLLSGVVTLSAVDNNISVRVFNSIFIALQDSSVPNAGSLGIIGTGGFYDGRQAQGVALNVVNSIPSAPANLTVTLDTDGNFESLGWQPVTPYPYQLYAVYTSVNGAPYQQALLTSQTSTDSSLLFFGAPLGSVIQYYVIAVDFLLADTTSFNVSEPSNTATYLFE